MRYAPDDTDPGDKPLFGFTIDRVHAVCAQGVVADKGVVTPCRQVRARAHDRGRPVRAADPLWREIAGKHVSSVLVDWHPMRSRLAGSRFAFFRLPSCGNGRLSS